MCRFNVALVKSHRYLVDTEFSDAVRQTSVP